MINKVILIGNLGKDAVILKTKSGHAVSNFSLATTHFGKEKEPTWHAITVWGKLAELLTPFLKKGKQIYLEGSLDNQKWTDTAGQARMKTVINAQVIQLLNSKEILDTTDTFEGF